MKTEPVEKSLKTGEAVLIAVREHPQTTAEVMDRVCALMDWDTRDKPARDRAYQAIYAQLQAGRLVKRDDPKTQLTHLYEVPQ